MKTITPWYLLAAGLMHNIWFSRIIPDEIYLKILYRGYMGEKLHLDNPITFNEKLNWLKLYDRKPEYTKMVDKYEVKKFVADKIGEEYIIPTYGVYDSADEIDFDSLPNQFVLKCTHDSGSVIICRDKSSFDEKKAEASLNKALKKVHWLRGREWPYKDVKPRIIAEEYLEEAEDPDLKDWKFFCFDGFAKALFVATDRNNVQEETKFDFYDMNFKHIPVWNGHPSSMMDIKKPEFFQKMVMLSQKLSEGIKHVRVDFYEINGEVYFGEMTFYHWSGLMPFVPAEWDMHFGEWIVLPEDQGGYLIASSGCILYVRCRPPGLVDYKFYCFNGKAKFLYVSEGLENHNTARISFVDLEWKQASFRRKDFMQMDQLPKKPLRFKEMVEVANRLSDGIAFVRVDLYEIGGKIYFSELTFSPCSGLCVFEPRDYDGILGKMLRMPVGEYIT